MCKHNEEDGYDCPRCCLEYGMEDAKEGLPCRPPYKDFSQCDEYYAGYNEVANLKRDETDETNRADS
jgi:hypothetical protein